MAQKVTGSKEVKSKVHELNNLLSDLNDQGGYFIDFISTKGIQAGIIRLHPGENDTQEPHSVEEVYYVIEGNGFIKLDGKDHQISEGQCMPKPTTGSMGISKLLYALGGRN
ncbi:MAG: cupin domain-containing protein [Candidatus Nitrosopolaris sp.]